MEHVSQYHGGLTAPAMAGGAAVKPAVSKPAVSALNVPALRYAIMDRMEQAVIVALWAAFFWRTLGQSGGWNWLVVASEGIVVAFVLFRRPASCIATDLRDWFLAFGATAAPLLLLPGGEPRPEIVPVAATLLLAGNLISLWAKVILRRSFGIAPANRGLKLSGPYRLVRHPMYSGYLLTHLGVLALMPSWYNLGVYGFAWTLQVLRLHAEERLLAQDEAYARYRQDVRYRLLPGIY